MHEDTTVGVLWLKGKDTLISSGGISTNYILAVRERTWTKEENVQYLELISPS
jgi:hypothetical protein